MGCVQMKKQALQLFFSQTNDLVFIIKATTKTDRTLTYKAQDASWVVMRQVNK